MVLVLVLVLVVVSLVSSLPSPSSTVCVCVFSLVLILFSKCNYFCQFVCVCVCVCLFHSPFHLSLLHFSSALSHLRDPIVFRATLFRLFPVLCCLVFALFCLPLSCNPRPVGNHTYIERIVPGKTRKKILKRTTTWIGLIKRKKNRPAKRRKRFARLALPLVSSCCDYFDCLACLAIVFSCIDFCLSSFHVLTSACRVVSCRVLCCVVLCCVVLCCLVIVYFTLIDVRF